MSKVLFSDADGVLFTGHETRTIIDGTPHITKIRYYPDGQGISFIRELGLYIVFVSGEGEPLQSVVEKMNNLPSVTSGRWKPVEVFSDRRADREKIKVIERWLLNHSINPSDAIYIGDDLNDFEPMRWLKENGGRIFAPANVQRVIAKLHPHILTKEGGNGALRELAELLVDEAGLDESTFPTT